MDRNLIIGIFIGFLFFWIFTKLTSKEAETFKAAPKDLEPGEANEQMKNLVEKLAADIKRAKDDRLPKEELVKISNNFYDSMNEIQKGAAAWKIKEEI
jgi:hypothetical protein